VVTLASDRFDADTGVVLGSSERCHGEE